MILRFHNPALELHAASWPTFAAFVLSFGSADRSRRLLHPPPIKSTDIQLLALPFPAAGQVLLPGHRLGLKWHAFNL